MSRATLFPTEDHVADALFGWLATVLGLPDDTDQLVKGRQNLAAVPIGSPVVYSPGLMQRQDFGRAQYAPAEGLVYVEAHNVYSYQVDCYGQLGPSNAAIIAGAWRSMWGVDAMARPRVFTPLYADAPQHLALVNSEGQFEQRVMVRLFGQVNHRIGLPQDYFTDLALANLTPADLLPELRPLLARATSAGDLRLTTDARLRVLA